jgi:hypothetical protein
MRGFIALCIIAFCIGLGVIVGNRMSSEALAVVVGVTCGVLAGIPTAVLLLILMRAQQRGIGDQRAQQAPQYPPIIVVGGTQSQPLLPTHREPSAIDGTWQPLGSPQREFRVIGEEK